MSKIINGVFLVFCLLAASIGNALGAAPTQYETVVEALESTHEFFIEDGTLKVLEDNPLEIELRIKVFAGDFDEIISEEVKRTIIYSLIVSFAQTDVSQMKVTVTPIAFDFKTKKETLLARKSQTVNVVREKMNKLLAEKIGINNCRELIGDVTIMKEVMPDMLQDASNRIMYNDQGSPGLNNFFASLVKK